MRLRIACMALLALSVSVAGFPQTTGNLDGRVMDNTGAVLPGVTVTITSPSMIQPQLVSTTNESGLYRFPAIPPGFYAVQFELPGFATLVREEIKVDLGKTTTLNASLEVAGLEETITVTGESPLVDVKNTKVGNVFDENIMSDVPSGRELWSLMNETPGVRPDAQGLDIGGSAFGTQWGGLTYGLESQNRFMFDGINTTEGQGGAGMYMDFGAFEEVQITTAAHKAEMPHPGRLTMVIMKSGGNEFHGHFYADYENPSWQGNNVDQALIDEGLPWADLNENGTFDSGEAGTRLKLYREFNGGVGGPIERDKIWFFANARHRRYARYPSGLYYPDGTRGYNDTWLNNFAIKGTAQLTQDDKIVGVFEVDRKTYPYRGSSATVPPDSSRKQVSPTYNAKGQWTHVFTPNTFLDLTVGRYYYWWRDMAYSLDVSTYDLDTRMYGGTIWARGIDWEADDGRWQNYTSVSHYEENLLGGRHDMKIGGEILNEWNQTRFGGWTDDIRLRLRNGVPYRVDLIGGMGTTVNRLWHIGAYIDDAWSVGDKLTLNLGVRFDNYRPYYPAQSREGNQWTEPVETPASGSIITWNDIAPRAGFVYDITGDGKTAIKASWGRFGWNPSYDITILANPSRQAYIYHYWNDINGNRQFDGREELGDYISTSGGALSSVDPNLKQPHTQQFAAMFERELIPDYSLRVGYVYTNAKDHYNDTDISRPWREQDWATGYEAVTAIDPGPDGAEGTPDDVGPIALFNLKETPESFQQVVTLENANEHWNNFEITLVKRYSKGFQLTASYLGTWNHTPVGMDPENYGVGGNPEQYYTRAAFVDPNGMKSGVSGYNEAYNWVFKTFGSYRMPYELMLGWSLSALQGAPWGRWVYFDGYYDDPVNRTGFHEFNQGTVTIATEEWGTQAYDTMWLLNLRLDKSFNLGGSKVLSVLAQLDNVLNSSTLLQGEESSSSRFRMPYEIPMPRIFKIGAKFEF